MSSNDDKSSDGEQVEVQDNLRKTLEDKTKLTNRQIDDCIKHLHANKIFTVAELGAFPVDKLGTLKGLKPKARSVLRELIPTLNESFRLKELFGVLNMFNYDDKSHPDYEAIARILEKDLEIDSWDAFLELREDDMIGIEMLNPFRAELLELISFANEWDKAKFEISMTQLRSRRAHNPEDLKDILGLYETYKATLNRALILASQQVPLNCSEQALSQMKEQLKADKQVFEEMSQHNAQIEVDDTDTELVSFSESFGELYLNEVLLSKLQQRFSPTVSSHIVTFVGATHVGKSTMIRQLVAPGKKAPAVAARGNYYPTTGNVHIYDTDMKFLHSQVSLDEVALIDIEGSNSPSIPKYVLNTFTNQIKKLLSDPATVERRRKAVNQHLPRFSYVISDVIVYIGEGSWANTEYRDTVIQFANAAVENVASAIRPCIIIVHNKCNLHEPMDVELMTKKFLMLHEGEESPILTRLYDSVKCISIPDWYHDQSLFDEQITKLKTLISEMLETQQHKRQRLGCLLTQHQWCDLLRYVVHNFTSKSLRIGTFVGELVSPENSLAKNAFHYFNTIYDARARNNEPGNIMKDFYMKCRNLAIEKLAIILLADTRKETTADTFYTTSPSEETLQLIQKEFQLEILDRRLSRWNHILEVLVSFVKNRAPCSAIYQDVYDESGKPVVCTQEFGQHDSHRSPLFVYSPSKDSGAFDRFILGVKRFLRIKIPSVWDGEFDFGSDHPSFDDDKQTLRNKIEKFQKLNSRDLFVATVETVVKATQDYPSVTISEEVCFICLVNNCNRRLFPCGHTFCEHCVKKLQLIQQTCPVCNAQISRVIEYHELSFKGGKLITMAGLESIRNRITEETAHPYKIVSIVGKIPHGFKKTIKNIETQTSLPGDRINPLRNWAFCSTFTGSRSCIYVEGEENKIIIVHYAVDRYHDKPCFYPFLTSDVVALLDTVFAFKMPEGLAFYPYIVEIVSNRPKIPHKLTLEGLMEIIAPPSNDTPSDDNSAILISSSNNTPQKQYKPIPIPAELLQPKSRYSLLEWCMLMNEVFQVTPNFFFHFVHGSESFIKKRSEFFVYSEIIEKSLIFYQMVEKKYSIVATDPLLSQMVLAFSVEAADKSQFDIDQVKSLLLELIMICRSNLISAYTASKRYYSLPIPFTDQPTDDNDTLFTSLDLPGLELEITTCRKWKERLQLRTSNPISITSTVLTLRRLYFYSLFCKRYDGDRKGITREIHDLLAKNSTYCLLCLNPASETVSLRQSGCSHSICTACWTNIDIIDTNQHLILDLVGKPVEKVDEPEEVPPTEPISIRKDSASGHRRNIRSQEPNPESSSVQNFKRSLLLFRCPICKEFSKERLQDYIMSDISLSRVNERALRIQCVLSEAEQGELTLHKHINHREISNLEPVSHDNVFRGKYGNMQVAVKFFKPYFIGFEWSRFRREVAILGMCKHPNIISFLGANVPDPKEIEQSNWQDESSSLRPFILSEYLPDTLSDIIRSSHKKLPINISLRYIYQIATALQFLHSMNLVHRDIKPANIVITADGQKAKLIDFGESRIVTGPREPLTKVGTPFYEAPEVAKGVYTDKVDTYSFGKMVYEMSTKSLNATILAVRSFYEGPMDISHLPDASCPEEILELITASCHTNPNARPDFENITRQLAELCRKNNVSV